MNTEIGHIIKVASLQDLAPAAARFIEEIGDSRLLAFYGKMGAGKTTFTAALCKALGVTDVVCSPTFTIVNEYAAGNGDLIYHFDFYRIKNYAEALDIGVEDYFYSGCLCIMEWPENIEGLLPAQTVKIRIEAGDDGSRTLSWK